MTYQSQCKQCESEFTSQKPAKFCSSKCRVTASRSVTAEPKSVTADVTADYTRKMVESRPGFLPNWYRLGYESRNAALAALEKNFNK